MRPALMSSAILRIPRAIDSPPDWAAAARTCGLVAGKLAGESALIYCSAKKRKARLSSSSRSTSSIICRTASQLTRYERESKSKKGFSRHSGAAKRRSGLDSGSWPLPLPSPPASNCHCFCCASWATRIHKAGLAAHACTNRCQASINRRPPPPPMRRANSSRLANGRGNIYRRKSEHHYTKNCALHKKRCVMALFSVIFARGGCVRSGFPLSRERLTCVKGALRRCERRSGDASGETTQSRRR